MHQRRGFTLVEIMIALVVLLLVTAAIFRLFTMTQRLSRAQAEQASMQANVRAGSLVVPTELRELNTLVGGNVDQNDILTNPLSATAITYRAMRGLGFVCQTPTATEIRLANRNTLPSNTYVGYRIPVANRDSLYLFLDVDSDRSDDDVWVPLQIVGVGTSPTSCPGSNPGITLTLAAGNAAVAALPSVPILTPVRIFEVMELVLYQANGKSWLGARSVSGNELTPQPMLGPLVDSTGFQLAYYDAAGNTTTDRRSVKSIGVTLRGITDQAINRGIGAATPTYAQDVLEARVVLRNSIRP